MDSATEDMIVGALALDVPGYVGASSVDMGCKVGVVTVVFEVGKLDDATADGIGPDVACEVAALEKVPLADRAMVVEADRFAEVVGTALGWRLSALIMSAAFIVH